MVCFCFIDSNIQIKKTVSNIFTICFFKEGKNLTPSQEMICSIYGASTMADQMHEKYSAKICVRDFLLNNAL